MTTATPARTATNHATLPVTVRSPAQLEPPANPLARMRMIPQRYLARTDLLYQALSANPPQTIESLPDIVHLALYQGDDFWLTLNVFADTGAPYSLASATPKAQVRHDVADTAPDVLAEFTATVSGNVMTLHLPTAQSTHMSVGTNRWDAQITVGGQVTTLCYGECNVTGEVTR